MVGAGGFICLYQRDKEQHTAPAADGKSGGSRFQRMHSRPNHSNVQGFLHVSEIMNFSIPSQSYLQFLVIITITTIINVGLIDSPCFPRSKVLAIMLEDGIPSSNQ